MEGQKGIEGTLYNATDELGFVPIATEEISLTSSPRMNGTRGRRLGDSWLRRDDG